MPKELDSASACLYHCLDLTRLRVYFTETLTDKKPLQA